MKEINQRELACISGGLSQEALDGMKWGAWLGALVSSMIGCIYVCSSDYGRKPQQLIGLVTKAIIFNTIAFPAIGATIGALNSSE